MDVIGTGLADHVRSAVELTGVPLPVSASPGRDDDGGRGDRDDGPNDRDNDRDDGPNDDDDETPEPPVVPKQPLAVEDQRVASCAGNERNHIAREDDVRAEADRLIAGAAP